MGRLEDQSLWHAYKTAVWSADTSGQARNESPEAVVVHNIMRTIRAIRCNGPFAYVSVPITSGRVLYDLQLGDRTMSRGQMMEQAIRTNYVRGLDFVQHLQRSRDYPVLYPADLTPVLMQWEQPHFQALWLSIIAEKCTEMHMSEGWEFSNGGVEEFTHVVQLRLGVPQNPDLTFLNTKEREFTERRRMCNIAIFDHRGDELFIDSGISAVEGSLRWIRGNRLEAPKVEKCLKLLRSARDLLMSGFYQ